MTAQILHCAGREFWLARCQPKTMERPVVEHLASPHSDNKMSSRELLLKLKPCPPSGEGVHSWLFHAACCAVEAGITDNQAVGEIEALMTRHPNPPCEIEDALRATRGERRSPSIPWPQVNEEQIEAIACDNAEILDLWRSWRRARSHQSYTEEIIDRLFPGNPWLCVGRTNQSFHTRRREDWRGQLAEYSLIVPSPMISQSGLTKSGHRSHHSLANTGSRRYLIIEADCGGLRRQAAVIWHLAKIAPLATAVFSGSKSLHGWFFCEGEPEDKLLRFMKLAVSLGADKRMWLGSQFCRIPDGRRSDNKNSDALKLCGWDDVPQGRQATLYFNPQALR
jgi:hypothetical protein